MERELINKLLGEGVLNVWCKDYGNIKEKKVCQQYFIEGIKNMIITKEEYDFFKGI